MEETESHEKGICNLMANEYENDFFHFFHKGPIAIYSGHCMLEKWENNIFWGLLDLGSEETLIFKDLKHYNRSSAGLGAYVDWIINKTLAYVRLTMDLLGVWTHSVFIS